VSKVYGKCGLVGTGIGKKDGRGKKMRRKVK
jgi:hypothetical protein